MDQNNTGSRLGDREMDRVIGGSGLNLSSLSSSYSCDEDNGSDRDSISSNEDDEDISEDKDNRLITDVINGGESNRLNTSLTIGGGDNLSSSSSGVLSGSCSSKRGVVLGSKGQSRKEKRLAKLKKGAEKEFEDNPQDESVSIRAAKLDLRRKKNDDYVAELKHKGLHNLSGEIDRCLKKVSEGVETFEDIWQKVHNATNTNQKEKYEADLKKEIKKLQRLRDQIKSWIASGEIKDKSALVETRKLIETQMERFKVVERETKTKAYSKEGLGAAQKLDPTTREREELNNWLIGSIDAMQIQVDQFESEIELMMAAKKKKLDKDKQDRHDELKIALERHRFHIGKLETLMRMLDNLSMDVIALRPFLSQVKGIKDDINYYLDSNQDPEFEENEFLYDDIEGLEEFDDGLTGPPVSGGLTAEEGDGTPTSITSGNNSPISPVHSSDASDPEKRRKSSDDSSQVIRPVAMKANHSPSSTVKGVIGTPPKGVGTPNNSSPSSGLSNHVSSLSSLSSSPTHNYHLNNSKSLSNSDSVEHNNSSLTGASITCTLSKSPSSNTVSTDGSKSLTAVNGILENGNSSEDHTSPHTQLISSSTPSSFPSLENGLISPPPEDLLSISSNSNSQQLNSSSTSTIGNNNLNMMNSERSQHHQLFADNNSLLQKSLDSTSSSSQLQQQQQQLSYPYLHQNLEGLGLSNNLSESGFATNISGVSSSNSLGGSNNSGGNSNSSSVLVGGSSNVIGLTLGGNQNSGSASNGSNLSSSSNANSSNLTAASSSASTVLSSTGGSNAGAAATTSGSGAFLSSTNNNNSGSGSLSASGGVSSHSSNQSGLSQQLQQFQQLQQQQQQLQGSAVQSGNSRDTTPISDYLRLHQPQDQMLLNRILNEPESMASLKSMAQDVLDRSGLSLGDHNMVENKMREAHIPPLLGVAPLGPVPLQKEHQIQFQMLDSAHVHMPVSADSERMRQFLPRNPYPTPHYYPQHPLTNSDSLEFFQRLSIETLFFIFYYLEGTKAQYLAAKVLKKQSWRFHTKYMMWFQRHEEPKVINEEYEQGTYIYFDIEKWGQRKKDGFVFEYRYLEDRDLG